MTLEQLYQRNEKFQQEAMSIADLIPGGSLLGYSITLMRNAKKLDELLKKVLQAKTEIRFFQSIEAIEEETDEIIFILDKMDIENRKNKIGIITDFLKRGYELLSLYSLCCDQIIEKKVAKEDEF